jgi:adenine-specific DNA-methyltransferase
MDINKINKTVKIDLKERLKEVYPEIFEDGKVNFEKLKSLLNGEIIEREDDRFYFNWAGKSNIYKIIQAPAYGTLKPLKEKSIDFDNTENIVIVGENLETLKLLLKPYFGKVKMIYIDPPYNTGKDFIYRDNFKEPLKDYLEKTGQIDSEGKKLTTNTETSGRYHSDWLNFMYPRLFLARSLLRDDGVIFISIDDNEVHHLRMIMDEIFGEENFIANIIWNSTKSNTNTQIVSVSHTFNLVYCKQIEYYIKNRDKFRLPESGEGFANPDNDPRGPWKADPFQVGGWRPNQQYEIINPKTGKVYKPNPGCSWKNDYETYLKLLEDNRIVFGKTGEGGPQRKRFLYEALERGRVANTWWDEIETTSQATLYLKELMNGDYFNNPKPVSLIKKMLQLCTTNRDLVLDFFAGSGTTGHAVWELNKEDGGNRKFILVQLDEEVQDEEIKKEFPTVADICIERLRRVSEKYKNETENSLLSEKQDFGFKVFKLDKSNFNLKDEFEFDPSENKEELKNKYIEWLGAWVNESLIPGWKKIDVIYEVMLKEGLNLNSKIEKIKIKDNEFYYVKDEEQNLDFYISLEDKFSKETIEEIRTSKYKGSTFIFLDNALTDNDKINLSAFVNLKVI